MRRRFGLEVAAVALVLIGCTAAPSERQSPPATASFSPSLGPTISASSTPTPASSAAEPLANIHTTPLGQVTGNWLFYGVRIPRPERNRVEVQIIAVPVGGGAAKIVVAFDAPSGGAPEGIFDSTPYLRRQFSPDGKRMVFSIDAQLVVVDLVTGRATPLGVRGYYPSWSRDGSLIAFVFEKPVADVVPPPAAIGVVPAAGGSPRELAVVGYERHSVEWSPDGSRILLNHSYGCVDACSEHATIEVATGRIGTRIGWVSSVPSYAHWRTGSPELAVATEVCARGDLMSGMTSFARIVGIDEGTGSVRTLVDVAEPCEVQLRDPRWNPAVADELLYVVARGTAGAEPNTFETHVLKIATGNDTRLPISAYEATWTWDGSAVAYLVKSPGSSFGSALRVWRRDGSGETELRRATGPIGEAFFSIASVSY